jgi:hypothetical protein
MAGCSAHALIEGACQYRGPPGDAYLLLPPQSKQIPSMNMIVFNSTGHMHAKYDISKPSGIPGH